MTLNASDKVAILIGRNILKWLVQFFFFFFFKNYHTVSLRTTPQMGSVPKDATSA